MVRKRKVDRKKKDRKKLNFLPVDEMDKLNQMPWTVPPIHALLNKSGSKYCRPEQISWLGKNYKIMVATGMLSNECFDAVAKVSATSISAFLELVVQTMKNFRRVRIARVVNDHVPTYEYHSPNKAVNKPMKTGQMKALVQKLFQLLFPKELIGEENWKIVVYNFVKVFHDLRNRGDVASFAELSEGVRLCEMKWLGGVSFKLKIIVLRNLLQYFVIFFINVLSVHFYVTMNSSGRIVYYRQNFWWRLEKKGFELLKAQRALSTTSDVTDGLPIHKLRMYANRFLPKTSGFRPIVTFKDVRISNELHETKAVLDLIIQENPELFGWGISNLRIFQVVTASFCWIARKNWMNLSTERILKRVLPEKRMFEVVRVTLKNSRLNYRYQRRVAGSNYAHAMQRLRCKKEESLSDNPIGVALSGQEVFRRICDFALRTIVVHNGVKFRAGCGIAQGNVVSVKLCNLYLGTVERTLFPERPIGLFCRRYVDDYIMISTSQEQIAEVVQKLHVRGIRYGVNLNSQKVASSFDMKSIPGLKRLKKKEKLAWCGFAFNTKTLTVTVDYHRYRKRRPVYNVPRTHPAEQFNILCSSTKRLLKSRYVSLQACAKVFPSHRRLALRRDFCRFAFEFYLRHFAKQLMLDLKHYSVRYFFDQLIRWIANDCRKRSLPDYHWTALITNKDDDCTGKQFESHSIVETYKRLE
uniref:Telomerase reverse transcriptase n=1 Tax=Ditylenchus dipsaci TaxID=166011 RepID=A0A915EHL8_9BILA